MNPEILKLTVILGSATVILIVGFFVQRSYLKKKKKQQEEAYGQYNNSSTSDINSSNDDYSNETIKNYILQYKSSYPRDSLKAALINSGNSESEVEKYLNKFL